MKDSILVVKKTSQSFPQLICFVISLSIFQVMSADGTRQVGKISKQWSGFVKESFTDADIFGISFPLDLDVRMKAVLLGAVFLIVSFIVNCLKSHTHTYTHYIILVLTVTHVPFGHVSYIS